MHTSGFEATNPVTIDIGGTHPPWRVQQSTHMRTSEHVCKNIGLESPFSA